jgi:C4-dicarboxylate transporter DctQ subunit
MSRFDRVLTWIENGLAALALGGASILAIIQVILRSVFGTTIFWTEEAIVYLIILSTFIGAVIALRHNEHVNFDVLTLAFKERGKWVLAIIGSFVTVIYCAIIGFFSWLLITEPAAQRTVTPALKLPLWVVELSLAIGMTLMFIRALEILYRSIRNQKAFDEAHDSPYEEAYDEGGSR